MGPWYHGSLASSADCVAGDSVGGKSSAGEDDVAGDVEVADDTGAAVNGSEIMKVYSLMEVIIGGDC